MKKKTKVMDEPRTEVWVLPLEMNNIYQAPPRSVGSRGRKTIPEHDS